MPFDPLNLRPDASMNRVVIANPLPSPNANAVRGRRSLELLPVSAFVPKIAAQAEALRLTDADLASPAHLPTALSRCLDSDNPTVRTTAEALADERAEYLAHHIATLHRGDPASRTARDDWDGSHWACWTAIRRIVLGGGTMQGALGLRVADTARAWLQRWDVDVTLEVAQSQSLLPLIGAARSTHDGSLASHAPPERLRSLSELEEGRAERGRGRNALASALVLDFGNTGAKAVIAHYQAGVLTALTTLPTQPTSAHTASTLPTPDDAQTHALAAFIVDTIATHWRRAVSAGLNLSPIINCSLACYLADNHPVGLYRGDYAALGALAPNLGAYLSDKLSTELAQPMHVELLHDGTTAARTYAGRPTTAVLMLGTWLGLGFAPPTEEGLCPMSKDLKISWRRPRPAPTQPTPQPKRT
jgi:hypothetical protein